MSRFICSQINPAMPDLVESIQLSITGVDDVDQLSAEITTIFHIQSSVTFTPFDQLSESLVRSWVDSHPSMENCKSTIAEMISNIRNPPYLEKTPPWVIVPVPPAPPGPPAPLVFATIGNISL